MSKPILLSTTSILEGWQILDYLGPISAQFVIGTGVFTDLFAGITDFFGAHSRSYQQKIDQITNEALLALRHKAAKLGANAVIGLRVDTDEISGGGKSMLMITAMGTAVRAQRIDRAIPVSETRPQRGALSADELEILVKKQRLLARAKNNTLEYDEDVWQFLIDHRIVDFAPFIFNRLQFLYNTYGRPILEGNFVLSCKRYFLTLPEEDVKPILYDVLGKGEPFFDIAFYIIRERKLFDVNLMLQGLEAEDLNVRKRYLYLARCDAALYSAADIPAMDSLVQKIQTAFPIQRKTYSKENKLFGAAKEMWLCVCGKEVPAKDVYCRGCDRDARGLLRKDFKPEEAAQLLQEKIDALKAALGLEVESAHA